jgi:hypothetical protein
MERLSNQKHQFLVRLRENGKSIPEISRETGVPRTTVLRHVHKVAVREEFKQLLRQKQGGSKERAKGLRENSRIKAEGLVKNMSPREYLFLLIGLYWGEGTKKDFAIINSDPLLIQAFIVCLRELNIPKDRLSFALRVHSDISIEKAKDFWSKTTGLPKKGIARVEIIEGKKKGKLPYGMCRIRIRAGIQERLLIQSAIALIGAECAKRLV